MPLPVSMRNVKLVVIDAPKQKATDGSLKRPTTADTFKQWLITNPTPGSCCLISNQPYVAYQDSVARMFLPATFGIETEGCLSSEEDDSISCILDSLARWLYQELMIVKKQENSVAIL